MELCVSNERVAQVSIFVQRVVHLKLTGSESHCVVLVEHYQAGLTFPLDASLVLAPGAGRRTTEATAFAQCTTPTPEKKLLAERVVLLAVAMLLVRANPHLQQLVTIYGLTEPRVLLAYDFFLVLTCRRWRWRSREGRAAAVRDPPQVKLMPSDAIVNYEYMHSLYNCSSLYQPPSSPSCHCFIIIDVYRSLRSWFHFLLTSTSRKNTKTAANRPN